MSSTDAFIAPVFTEVLLTALSRFMGAREPHELYIGSPWLVDVPLFPGIFVGTYPFLLPNIDPIQMGSLGAFVRTWIASGGSAVLLTQGYHPDNRPLKNRRAYNERELAFLSQCREAGAQILIAHRFHDKFLLVPDVVLSGSVNVTYSGLYQNRERLSLNTRSSSPNDFLSARTVCMNHVATARQVGPCAPPRNPCGIVEDESLERLQASFGGQWR